MNEKLKKSRELSERITFLSKRIDELCATINKIETKINIVDERTKFLLKNSSDIEIRLDDLEETVGIENE